MIFFSRFNVSTCNVEALKELFSEKVFKKTGLSFKLEITSILKLIFKLYSVIVPVELLLDTCLFLSAFMFSVNVFCAFLTLLNSFANIRPNYLSPVILKSFILNF